MPLWCLGAAALLALSASCVGDRARRESAPPTSASASPSTAAPSATQSPARDPAAVALNAKVAGVLARMTLEDKVGQLFVTYAYGSTATTSAPADVAANRALHGVANGAELVAKYRLGGLTYFGWSGNVDNPRQIAQLSNGLQDIARKSGAKIPLLISVDQEQGMVSRIGPPATQFPGSMALGAGGSDRDAYSAALITGRELSAMGINQDFAPVSDVNVNPRNPIIGVRSPGSSPSLVAAVSAAQVTGYQDANVAATAKHFPGHGDTTVDSHTGIPVISHTRAQWDSIDRPPFQANVRQHVDSIMTAHIVVPSLDPSGLPATLSRPIISGILRGEMGYDGVVITDALGMAGVRAKYGDARVPVLALKAGVDQLLMPPSLPQAYASVLAAVRAGELTQKRIDESVTRILRLKFTRHVFDRAPVDAAHLSSVVGTPGHRAAAQQITDRTITLIKNDKHLIPLPKNSGKSVLVTGWGARLGLASNLAARGVSPRSYETGKSPSPAETDRAVRMARSADLTVVLTNRAWSDPRQRALVVALLATRRPIIVAALDAPYDLAYFAAAPTYLATYSSSAASLQSLAAVLFGDVRPTGKLPVSIPRAAGTGPALYDVGYGLSPARAPG